MSILAASKSKKPRPPPSSSFLSLPDDVALNCLARVPRCYDLNISFVSKTLRSLVRSAELYRLRTQLLPKTSIYLSFRFFHGDCIHWFTFRPGEKKATDYMPLADVPIHYYSVSVESEIYFISGGCNSLWILDTRSGHLRTAPRMKVHRWMHQAAMVVVDGMIYVIGGTDEESRVELFDTKTQTWEFAGTEQLEGKVYIVDWDCVHMKTYSLTEGISNETTERLSGTVKCLCVVEDVLYALKRSELMWFNTKLKVWRRVVDRDGKLEMYSFIAEKWWNTRES